MTVGCFTVKGVEKRCRERFGSKEEEVTGGGRKLSDVELHDL